MKERRITVTYTLSEEQAERLEKLTKAWNAAGDTNELPSTPAGLFNFMMILGSERSINEKLDFLEEYVTRLEEQKAKGK